MKANAASKSDTRYLQRIGFHWYARIPVPNRLWKEMGPYLHKSLDTLICEKRKNTAGIFSL